MESVGSSSPLGTAVAVQDITGAFSGQESFRLELKAFPGSTLRAGFFYIYSPDTVAAPSGSLQVLVRIGPESCAANQGYITVSAFEGGSDRFGPVRIKGSFDDISCPNVNAKLQGSFDVMIQPDLCVIAYDRLGRELESDLKSAKEDLAYAQSTSELWATRYEKCANDSAQQAKELESALTSYQVAARESAGAKAQIAKLQNYAKTLRRRLKQRCKLRC